MMPTSKYRGVTKGIDGKFMARVTYRGTRFFLGRYDTEEEAARACDRKNTELFGDRAKLNFHGDK